uniref:Phospholipase A2 n=1 Tax=Noctiluca scintillans TaxID=2966 RepID=A0A7S1AIF1_NOCSC|mmetsp:Transcript_47223/g.125432  ORF Transcript_47223/g.125432 Transcript_47223/m.125432 type:complete len:146 (+) Transcript_47223:53-490(+)
MAWLRFFLFTCWAPLLESLKLCGNFCGPDWCNGRATPECQTVNGSSCSRRADDCDETNVTDGSCADGCCQMHDACCGSMDRARCNRAIITCLEGCMSGPVCLNGYLPVYADVVLTAMELDPYGCCGTSCDLDSAVRSEKSSLRIV